MMTADEFIPWARWLSGRYAAVGELHGFDRDDLAQEALLAAHDLIVRRLYERALGDRKHYVMTGMRLAVKRAIHRRARRARVTGATFSFDEELDSLAHEPRPDARIRLAEGLATLHPKVAAVAAARLRGATDAEIAAEHGVRPGTISAWMARYAWPLLRALDDRAAAEHLERLREDDADMPRAFRLMAPEAPVRAHTVEVRYTRDLAERLAERARSGTLKAACLAEGAPYNIVRHVLYQGRRKNGVTATTFAETFDEVRAQARPPE